MPIASDLLGTYSNQINGMKRSLSIAAQDAAKKTISGTWASSINGVATSFPVTGTYVPAEPSGSSALFFAVQGTAQTANTKQVPPIMRAIEVVVGYAEIAGPGQVDQLYVTIAWAEDKPGNAKETSAWLNLFLKRQ
jgi:hypothetical protein